MVQKIQANNLKKLNAQPGANSVSSLHGIMWPESSRTNMLLQRVHTRSQNPGGGILHPRTPQSIITWNFCTSAEASLDSCQGANSESAKSTIQHPL